MPHSSDGSPFRDGFAALWHEPLLFAGELVWRWCFGFSAWLLAIVAAALFLDSLKISAADEFLLSTWQPALLIETVRHIFRGSLARFAAEQIVLLLGLTLLWCIAATLGRAAVLQRLVAMFSIDEEPDEVRWDLASIFRLNVLRAAWLLIALAVAIACLTLGSVMVGDHRAAWAAFFFVFGVGLACWFGMVLNWFLGLAPLFCIRTGATAREGLAQSIDFISRRGGRVFLLGLGFFLLRLVWFGTMAWAVLSPVSLFGHVVAGWVLLIMGVLLLVYCAGADYLRLAQLSAYASLAEDDAHPVPEVP